MEVLQDESIRFYKIWRAEVFEELELPKPKASEKGVLIKVQAVGINPYDALLRAGTMQKIRPLEFPIVPGSDIVGKIVEVGSKVKNYAIGDIVIAHPAIGGYAEYVATPSYNVVKKPKEMGVEEAAGLASAGITAYYALQIANVKKRRKPGHSGRVRSSWCDHRSTCERKRHPRDRNWQQQECRLFERTRR